MDLMYACNVYKLTDAFEKNIVAETRDNLRRIRHHASLGLICGNNEMETGWQDWPAVKRHSPALKADYIKQFEYVLKKECAACAPQTEYWPSSPSSGGSFDDPNSYDRGDVHYWDVWHGLKPFSDYRDKYPRFCSEFGFESFPDMKTVAAFTLPQDRNIFSRVMESHQKCVGGNGKIMYYLSQNYRYPTTFAHVLYASQRLQAEAIRTGVEHWRRNRGRCMGAVYWQLNDCWPVASWASVDSLGRWKQLHYAAKRFFAPVLASIDRRGPAVRSAWSTTGLNPSGARWKRGSSTRRARRPGAERCRWRCRR
jgi:beta-mannosidase